MPFIFTRRQIVKALKQDKTVINFQFVDGIGSYLGNGSLDMMFNFIAASLVKIFIQAGDQFTEDDVKKILTNIRRETLRMYRLHKDD